MTEAYEKVKQLVRHFRDQEAAYLLYRLTEEEIRVVEGVT